MKMVDIRITLTVKSNRFCLEIVDIGATGRIQYAVDGSRRGHVVNVLNLEESGLRKVCHLLFMYTFIC